MFHILHSTTWDNYTIASINIEKQHWKLLLLNTVAHLQILIQNSYRLIFYTKFLGPKLQNDKQWQKRNQKSKMGRLSETIELLNYWTLVWTISEKCSILDVWQGSGYILAHFLIVTDFCKWSRLVVLKIYMFYFCIYYTL